MPSGMSGIELAPEMNRRNNSIKVLLTSGFAASIMEQHRAVNELPIIDKPFRLPDSAPITIGPPMDHRIDFFICSHLALPGSKP